MVGLIESAALWTDLGAHSRAPRAMSMSQLFATEHEQIEWLVDHLLLASGLSLVGAKPKVAKSVLVRNLIFSVVRGEDFLGRKTKRGPAIYICQEDSIAIVRDHFKRLGVLESDPITFVTDELTMDQLRDLIREHSPVLVAIDPFYRFAGIKRVDDYVENMQALAKVDAVCKEFGIHFCLVHHAGKGVRDDDFDSILGSTALFGGVETCILLKRHPTNDTRTVRTRSRLARDIPETFLDFDPAMGRIMLGQSTESAHVEVRRDKAEALEASISLFVSEHPGCTEDEIKAEVTGKDIEIRSAVARMVVRDALDKTGNGVRGDPFRYSLKTIPVAEDTVIGGMARLSVESSGSGITHSTMPFSASQDLTYKG